MSEVTLRPHSALSYVGQENYCSLLFRLVPRSSTCPSESDGQRGDDEVGRAEWETLAKEGKEGIMNDRIFNFLKIVYNILQINKRAGPSDNLFGLGGA